MSISLATFIILSFSLRIKAEYNLTAETLVSLKPGNRSIFGVLLENQINPGTLLAALDHGVVSVDSAGNMHALVGLANKNAYREGIGTTARFHYIIGMLQFQDGNLIVADNTNRCLRMIQASNYNTSTYAGKCLHRRIEDRIQDNQTLADARFFWPGGMSFLPGTERRFVVQDGTTYSTIPMILDMDLGTVRVLFSFGVPAGWNIINRSPQTFLFGAEHGLLEHNVATGTKWLAGKLKEGTATNTGFEEADFYQPVGLILLSDRYVIMTEIGNHRLSVLDLEQNMTRAICSGLQGHQDGDQARCKLDRPWSLTFLNDTLYVGEIGRSGGGIRSFKLPKEFHRNEKIGKLEEAPTTSSATNDEVTIISIAAFAATFLLVIIIVTTVGCLLRHKRKRANITDGSNMGMDQECNYSAVANPYGSADNEQSRFCSWIERLSEECGIDEFGNLKTLSTILIPSDQLEIVKIIGKGHFGLINHGIWNSSNTNQEVAVKSIKIPVGQQREQLMAQFLREAAIMQQFRHPNVLEVLGICWNGQNDARIVLPFMSNGDLHELIKTLPLSTGDVLQLGEQIASGMSYMSKLRFVHRDLAARNCLVSSNFVVKIADFGLSRDVYGSENYYVDVKTKALPWKWMAPECMAEGKFTVNSDVWAFGVLLWELFTKGVTPYPAYNGIHQLEESLAKGYRLSKPTACPDDVFAVMRRTWDIIPENRPSFDKLCSKIKRLFREHQTDSGYNYTLAFEQRPKDDYYLTVLEESDEEEEPQYIDSPQCDYIEPLRLTRDESEDSLNTSKVSLDV